MHMCVRSCACIIAVHDYGIVCVHARKIHLNTLVCGKGVPVCWKATQIIDYICMYRCVEKYTYIYINVQEKYTGMNRCSGEVCCMHRCAEEVHLYA